MKNKISILVAALVLAAMVALVGCGGGGGSTEAAAGGSSMYTDGTYTGSGMGKSGNITVTLTIANDQITDVDIVDPGETVGIGGAEAIADGTYADQIIAAQGSDIEGIVGATLTTNGVKDAVDDALAQAAA